MDHRNLDHRLARLRQVLVTLAQAAASTQPGEGPPDIPAVRRPLEVVEAFRPADEPRAAPATRAEAPLPLDPSPGVSAVGQDQPQPARPMLQVTRGGYGPAAVPHVGRTDDDRQDQAGPRSSRRGDSGRFLPGSSESTARRPSGARPG